MIEGTNLTIATTDQIKQVVAEAMQEYKLQPHYYRPKDAAKYLNVSESQIHNLKNQGLLDCCQPVPGGLLRFTRAQLDAFMESNQKKVAG